MSLYDYNDDHDDGGEDPAIIEALEFGEIDPCPQCHGEPVSRDEDGYHACMKCKGTGYVPGCGEL